MIREIITYPNKLLRTKSKDVEEFNSELHTLLDDMYETMIAASGVGLAAIQIAVPLNVLIINPINEEDIQDKNDLIEAINPKITHKDGELVYQEGCLSVPGFYEDVIAEYKAMSEKPSTVGEFADKLGITRAYLYKMQITAPFLRKLVVDSL
jgi:peptide deformylase